MTCEDTRRVGSWTISTNGSITEDTNKLIQVTHRTHTSRLENKWEVVRMGMHKPPPAISLISHIFCAHTHAMEGGERKMSVHLWGYLWWDHPLFTQRWVHNPSIYALFERSPNLFFRRTHVMCTEGKTPVWRNYSIGSCQCHCFDNKWNIWKEKIGTVLILTFWWATCRILNIVFIGLILKTPNFPNNCTPYFGTKVKTINQDVREHSSSSIWQWMNGLFFQARFT